jgi:hypothetical protein
LFRLAKTRLYEYAIVELVLVCHVFNGFVKLVHNISLSAPFGFLDCSYLCLSPAADLAALLDGLAEQLPNMQLSLRNTVILFALWAVWKSRNRMVFDNVSFTASQVASLAASHLRLWVVRAPRRVDLVPLHSWCDTVS